MSARDPTAASSSAAARLSRPRPTGVARHPFRRARPLIMALPAARALALSAAVAVAACALGVLAGSTGLAAATSDIFWQIRVPRVLAGFGTGAALAVSGALMQLLTRNALADPYVLGVAGGASVGALGTMLLAGAGGAALSEWSVAFGAAAGAFLAATLLFALMGRRLAGSVSAASGEGSTSLLLVGIMIGSGCSAIVSLILTLADEGQLRGMV